jgi:uncharacterized protein
MQCFVYKSLRRADTFLYVGRRDDFEAVPAPLRERLGQLHFVLELELHPQRRLARVEAGSLIQALAERGFYLQLPPNEERRADALD